MRKFLVSTPAILFTTAVWTVISLGASIAWRDWLWFARGGSILTLAGALLAARPLLRFGREGLIHEKEVIDLGHVVPTEEEEEASRQTRHDVVAQDYGFWIAVIGTVIWGYGDLVGKLFPQ